MIPLKESKENLSRILQTAPAVLLISLPVIFEMLLNSLLNLSDTLMISRFVNAEALAGVGFANQISYFVIFIFTAFNVGAVAMVSRFHGERHWEALRTVIASNFLLNLLLGILVFAIMYFWSDKFFIIYELSPESLAYGTEYFKVLSLSLPPLFVTFAGAATMRGSQNTRTPLVITAITNVVNVIGNYLLILGVGIFPEMGVSGAALATVIARYLGASCFLYFLFISRRSPIRIALKELIKFDFHHIKTLFRLSALGALEQTIFQTSFLVMGVGISSLSSLEEAAARILISIESLSFLPAIGLSIGTGTLLGETLGKKEMGKAKEIGYCSLILCTLWGFIALGLFFLVGEHAVSAFINPSEKNLLPALTPIIPLLALNQPGLSLVINLTGIFRGAGDVKAALLFSFLRMWVFLVPLTLLAIMVWGWGLKGLWIVEIFVFLAFIIFMLDYFRGGKWQRIDLD